MQGTLLNLSCSVRFNFVINSSTVPRSTLGIRVPSGMDKSTVYEKYAVCQC